MTPSFPGGAWFYAKRRALAAISAVLMYLGIVQIVSTIKYPSGNAIMGVINLIIENALRDHMLLGAPYTILGLRLSMARGIAIGAMVIVVGIFVGLLADWKVIAAHRK